MLMRIFFGEFLGNLLSSRALWIVAFVWLCAFKSEEIIILFKEFIIRIIKHLIGV
ncbi:hypothetical protein [Campylobacter hyointestinalis]|nr:hypothetical protein [Campylobacter hyointestinalis]